MSGTGTRPRRGTAMREGAPRTGVASGGASAQGVFSRSAAPG